MILGRRTHVCSTHFDRPRSRIDDAGPRAIPRAFGQQSAAMAGDRDHSAPGPCGRAARPASSEGETPTAWRHSAVWPLPPLPLEPLDVAWLSAEGAQPRAIVADGRNRRVLVVHASSGDTLDTWAPPAAIVGLSPLGERPSVVFPLAVAADGARDRVYILWAEIGWDDPRFRGFSPLYIEARSSDGTPIAVSRRQPGFLLDGRLGAIVDLSVDPASGRLLSSVGGHVDILDPLTGESDAIGRLGREDELARIAAMSDGGIALAGPSVGLVVRYDAKGEIVDRIDVGPEGLAPVAVAGDVDGRLAVLVRPAYDPESEEAPPVSDPLAPMLLWYGSDGSRLATYSSEDLGVPPPRGLWPLSLDIDSGGIGSGLSFVTTGENFEVRLFQDPARPSAALVGSTAGDVPAWLPNLDIDETAFASGIALLRGGPGAAHLSAVDNRDSVLAAYSARGALTESYAIPSDLIDIGMSDVRSMYTSAEEGQVARYDGPPYAPEAPIWSAGSSLSLGGRLAVGAANVWVTRPRERSIVPRSLETGIEAPDVRIERPESIGLWPTDIALAGDGSLLAADIIAKEVSRWDPSDATLRTSFPVGLVAGPYRIASVRLDSGADLVVALTADGALEAHGLAEGGANLISRWRPRGP